MKKFIKNYLQASPRTPVCPECKIEMVLRKTPRFTDRVGNEKMFWACQNYPFCTMKVGAHPNGSPLGIPGDVETRHARIKLHDALAQKFAAGDWRTSKKWQRDEMYQWMRMHAPKRHVGWMTKEECAIALELLKITK